MNELRLYLTEDGTCPFEKWFDDLDAIAAAKVTAHLKRLELGNRSNVKSVGEGVSELKIDFGPGYRVYFGLEGEALVILLCGGSKKRQDRDIARAKRHWAAYKARKRKD